MNILFITYFFVGCMVTEIPRVSVVGQCPYSVTFLYTNVYIHFNVIRILFLIITY